MCNILIVDDEQIERDGIKFLIEKYHLELSVAEAENGEDALEYIKANPVDILFTDIKMPFMDGLDLSEKARELDPDIKIIIFSAYGEFDYAKRAIGAYVNQYILKPIDADEFLNVFSNVIALCRKEQIEKEKTREILEIYNKGIEYEKEKILIDLINGVEIDEQFNKRIKLIGIEFSDKYIQMIMVDFRSKFFDANNDEFRKVLNEIVEYEYEYINLNEQQSVIFLLSCNNNFEKVILRSIGEKLKNRIYETYKQMMTVVVGNTIDSIKEICNEFNNIESMLDFKFFFDESVIFFCCGDFLKNSLLPQIIEKFVNNIHLYFNSNDYYSLESFEKNMEMFFDKLEGQGNISVTYVKNICAEIIKRAFEKKDERIKIDFEFYVKKIFNSDTLVQLKQAIQSVIKDMKSISRTGSNEENKKVIKVIKEIINIIEENYMNDLSLEWVANKVYLAPSYLSYLFKKEMGQSFVKYITSYRLEKVSDLLLNTHMKIVDICQKVGYSNASYFCQIFKSYYGVSPTKFREKDE